MVRFTLDRQSHSLITNRDITQFNQENKLLRPTRTYTHHAAVVNDVQYHPLHASLIGTASDDLTFQILDTRKPDTTVAAIKGKDGHTDAINALSFNPASEYVVVTGSVDTTIGIWDLRNVKSKLHVLTGHRQAVTSLSWHPFEEAILASTSCDRRIMFWDLSRVGEEQGPDDAEDGPPELYVPLFLSSFPLPLPLLHFRFSSAFPLYIYRY